MPRLIDHDARHREIAAASLRVLERDGLGALSVRGVADEAGIAAASLRRAFPTQHALREYCLVLIEERVTARIADVRGGAAGRALVEAILAQLLPLDAERRSELVAQIQLGVLALTDVRLRASTTRLNDAVGQACRACLGILDSAGALGSGRDVNVETDRLHALIDGVALQLVWDVAAGAPDRAAGILARHLDDISRDVGGAG